MNNNKKGKSFIFPDSFILAIRYSFHLPYRQTAGIVKGHAGNNIPSIPDFSIISRRINRLDVKIDYNKNTKELEDR